MWVFLFEPPRFSPCTSLRSFSAHFENASEHLKRYKYHNRNSKRNQEYILIVLLYCAPRKVLTRACVI